MAIIFALLTVIVGFVAGVALIAADHVLIGLAAAFFSLPLAFAVWITTSDRRA